MGNESDEPSEEGVPLDNDYRIVLERWRDQVLPHKAASQKWMEISADFALTAVRSALIVNAGALVALPPLMEWVGDIQRDVVIHGAVWFVLGLSFSFGALLTAYYNYLRLSWVADAESHLAALQIKHPALSRADKLKTLKEYADKEEDRNKHNKWVGRTQMAGVILFVLSVVFFLVGVGYFMFVVDVSEKRVCHIFINEEAIGFNASSMIGQCSLKE